MKRGEEETRKRKRKSERKIDVRGSREGNEIRERTMKTRGG